MSQSLYTKIIETTAPTSATVGVVGQWYLDSTTKKLYECKAVTTENDTTTYVWEEIGGGADEALRNNTVQIESSTGLCIGGAIKNSTDIRNIAIGKSARIGANSVATTAVGYNAAAYMADTTAVGGEAYADSSGGTAIGYKARVTSSNSIQLGAGTNSTSNTLQVRSDNIYKTDTHTLTVQNIQLNGTDINTVIDNKIASAITTALNTAV